MFITRIIREFTYGGFTIKYTDYCEKRRGSTTRDILVKGFEGSDEKYSYLGVANSIQDPPQPSADIPEYTKFSEIMAVVQDMIANVCKRHGQEVPMADGVANERITYNIVAENRNSYEVTATLIDKLSYVLRISPDHEEVVNLAYDDYGALEDLVKSFLSEVAA